MIKDIYGRKWNLQRGSLCRKCLQPIMTEGMDTLQCDHKKWSIKRIQENGRCYDMNAKDKAHIEKIEGRHRDQFNALKSGVMQFMLRNGYTLSKKDGDGWSPVFSESRKASPASDLGTVEIQFNNEDRICWVKIFHPKRVFERPRRHSVFGELDRQTQIVKIAKVDELGQIIEGLQKESLGIRKARKVEIRVEERQEREDQRNKALWRKHGINTLARFIESVCGSYSGIEEIQADDANRLGVRAYDRKNVMLNLNDLEISFKAVKKIVAVIRNDRKPRKKRTPKAADAPAPVETKVEAPVEEVHAVTA